MWANMSDIDNPDRNSWLRDAINPDLIQLHSLKRVIYSGKTEFQSVDIVETGSFGVALVLDGRIQSSAQDEFIYHEALVHPAMISHAAPATVCVVGGGEGAALREVLAHNTVKRAVMVDIDKQVVDICRRFLPGFHQGAFDDSRTEMHFADARKYLAETKDKFDVIIIDLVEPLEGGPACLLYTREFYQIVKQRLNFDGIICVQSGASSWTNMENFAAIISTLKSVFTIVRAYQVYVPSFVDLWGFATCSQAIDPTKLSAKEIDRRISARLSRDIKSYDGLTHQAMFILPKHIRNELTKPGKIITDEEPISTYSSREWVA